MKLLDGNFNFQRLPFVSLRVNDGDGSGERYALRKEAAGVGVVLARHAAELASSVENGDGFGVMRVCGFGAKFEKVADVEVVEQFPRLVVAKAAQGASLQNDRRVARGRSFSAALRREPGETEQ